MFIVKHIFTNRNTIMLLALFLGLFAGGPAKDIEFLSMPVLSFMMIVSLVFFDFKIFRSSKKVWPYLFSGIFFNYILSGLILMGLVYFLMPYQRDIFLGFLFIIFAPPGVVIVPFATIFKGHIDYATTGVLGGYLILLIIFPLLMFFIEGSYNVSLIWDIIKILLALVIIPLIISRFLRHQKTYRFVSNYRGPLINWSFFIIIYIVIGINRSLFINDIGSLLWPVIVLCIFLFGFTYLLDKVLKKMKFDVAMRRSQILMFAVKNNGFSAVVSLNLIGAQAAIPSAALSIVLLLYLIYFSFVHKTA